jgi:hypothetical protein
MSLEQQSVAVPMAAVAIRAGLAWLAVLKAVSEIAAARLVINLFIICILQ